MKFPIESLESRQMLSSVALVDGALLVQGDTDRPNVINVTIDKKTTIVMNGKKFVLGEVPSGKIGIIGGQKNDTIAFLATKRSGLTGGIGLCGWDGDDFISAVSTQARVDLNGGYGNDTMIGGNGNDWLQGDQGQNVMVGNNGDDTFTMQESGNVVFGGPGDDTMFAGVFSGDAGGNTLLGGAGNDRFWVGDSDSNVVFGGGGYDVVSRFASATPLNPKNLFSVEEINFDMTGLG